MESESVCHHEVPWKQRQDDSDRKRQPEIGGTEQVMVVSIDGSREPTRSYNGIYSLNNASDS